MIRSASSFSHSNSHRVDIIIYPGFKSLEAIGLISVFTSANRQLQRRGRMPIYDVGVVSQAEANIESDTGVILSAGRKLSKNDLPDTAFVTGTPEIEFALENNNAISEWCSWAAINNIGCLAGLCSGSFFLAEAGLLNGKRATTHWSVIELMRQRYPQVQVEKDCLYVRSGRLWTSAGVSTAVDLALAFVEEDCGTHIAHDVARDLVIFIKRSGGQSQVSASLVSQATSSIDIRQIENWILEHLDAKLSVKNLAKLNCMSVRHFSRVFREVTGLSPSRFVERARVESALRFLEDTSLPLKVIAFRSGFASDEQMRKVFKKRLSITAREYRRRRESIV